MRRVGLLMTFSTAAVLLAGCAAVSPLPQTTDEAACPSSVEEASDMAFADDIFVGAGHVIRFVPSPDEAFRGYDLDISQMFTGSALRDVAFLRINEEIPGMSQGDAVLLVARRTDEPRVFTPGPCLPLVPVPASAVES